MIATFLAAILIFDGQSISGTVVDSVTGVPLSKAQVSVNRSNPTTSDSEGHFNLKDLSPGEYLLRGERNGYLEGAQHITLEAGQDAKSVKVAIARFSVIAGTVRDTDGEPMANIGVNVSRISYNTWGRRRLSGVGGSESDDLGHYRVTGLEPGRYSVTIERDAGPARSVELQSGQRAEGIDLSVTHPSTVRVSGHAVWPMGTERPSVSLSAGDSGYSASAEVKPNGDFEFARIPAGAYTLMARASVPLKPTTDPRELFSRGMGFVSRMAMAVGTEPIQGVTISIEPGVEITGHINMKTGAQVVFHSDEWEMEAIVHDDQTFSISLPQGHFYLDRQMAHDYVVGSVLLDGRDILDDGLIVAGPGKVSLEITLTKDGGHVDGVVADKDGKPVPGATVVLVPEARRRSHPDLFQNVEADQLGRFKLEAIPPGDYKLFAWTNVEYGIWRDPDFLPGAESRGESVSIKAGSRETKNLICGSLR